MRIDREKIIRKSTQYPKNISKCGIELRKKKKYAINL